MARGMRVYKKGLMEFNAEKNYFTIGGIELKHNDKFWICKLIFDEEGEWMIYDFQIYKYHERWRVRETGEEAEKFLGEVCILVK